MGALRVVAIVVTYNRCLLLSRCIDHLQSQVRPPDEILVINNGSSDGTLDMLRQRGISVMTQSNVGSAGGWCRGIQYALDSGFDAVWLMDDDGFPDAAALGFLIHALKPGVACASSVVLREDKPSHFVFSFPVLDERGLPVLFRFPRKIKTLIELKSVANGMEYPFAHFFNGALISMNAVREVGNVDRDFFIFGDEVDYFFRLHVIGRVISCLDAFHYHPDVSGRPYSMVKIYYYLKNSLILNSRYLNFVWARHLIVVFAVLVRSANRNGLRVAFSLLAGRSSPVFYKAIVRGLQGRIGRDFDE